jgi:tetratricopeptide (TPR) repeat protein
MLDHNKGFSMYFLHIANKPELTLLKPHRSVVRGLSFFLNAILFLLFLILFAFQTPKLIQEDIIAYLNILILTVALNLMSCFFLLVGLQFHGEDRPRKRRSKWIPILITAEIVSFLSLTGNIVFRQYGVWGIFLWSTISSIVAGISLVALFVAYLASKRTYRTLETFSIALSERYITRNVPFSIFCRFSFKQVTEITMLQIWLHYREHTGQDEYGDTYQEEKILVQDTGPFRGHPSIPLVETFSSLISLGPTRFSQGRKNWYLSVHIYPQKGRVLSARYPVQVIDERPVSNKQLASSHPSPPLTMMPSLPSSETRGIQVEELFQKGRGYMQRYHYGEALKAFEEAARLDPLNAKAHLGRCGTLLALGYRNKALEAVNEALRLSPNYGHAHYNKGLVLASFRDDNQAMAEAKRRDPPLPIFPLFLTQSRLLAGRIARR